MKRIAIGLVTSLVLAGGVASAASAQPGDSTDLGVSISADQTSYKVGDLVTYTLTITNYGEAAADEVTLTDLLPAGLDLVSTSVASTPDASSDMSFATSSVPAGQLVPDLVAEAIDAAGDTYDADRIGNGAMLDLGYDVGANGGETLVTGTLGWLGSETYWSTGDSTETMTIVARATASGQYTDVASVDSTTNPDPNEAANNYADATVSVS